MTSMRLILIVLLAVFGSSIHFSAAISQPEKSPSPKSGLIVLYDFSNPKGDIVKDVSGVGKPCDLKIENPKTVKRSAGELKILSKTKIRSTKPAVKIIDAVMKTGEMTIEAWIQPSNLSQKGPARIVTLSKDSVNRNFTFGQDADKFEVRFRTKKTSNNGIPSLISDKKTVTKNRTHLVYTFDRNGEAKLYSNEKLIEKKSISGTPANWNKSYKLALGDEFSGGRPWLGTLYKVAIYNRDLSLREIQQNYKRGYKAKHQILVQKKLSPSKQLFNSHVAGIIADRCLECHDTATNKGGLDLSKKIATLKGGDSDTVLVAGQPSKSALWLSIESDEMPHNRSPLLPAEKQSLKAWIASGAEWTVDEIDPAVYMHNQKIARNWLRRLTVHEYIATVKSTMGVDIAKEANEILPKDLRADGFSNTAYNLNIDLKHVESYAILADEIVSQIDVLAFAARFKKGQSLIDKHMIDLIEKMGQWVLRGPLKGDEVALYRGVSTTVASAGGNYEEAVRYIIEAMLQSPRFIYLMESQSSDGEPMPISPFELASRTSYILWGASPDKELLNSAKNGELTNPDEMEKQIQRMLKDPRAVDQSCMFISEWLNLNHLDNLNPDKKMFPNWNSEIAADMKKESIAVFKEVVWKENRPISDLLNVQFTFATPRLAKHYGFKSKGDGFQKYDLKNVPSRGGILTHGSVLTVGGDEASMVTRGLFVLHDLLRGVVKDPPPCVDTTPISSKPGTTNRTVAMSRLKNEACGGCHKKFEPLAFGLEKYDGLGAFSEKDHFGNQLREDGDVLVPGESQPTSFKTSAELMNLLAQSERVKETFTWKLTQFAIGRPLVQRDAATVQKIHKTALKNGGTYASLMSAILKSDLVQMTQSESSGE